MKRILSFVLTVIFVFSLVTMATSCSNDDVLIVYTESGFAPWETTKGTEYVGVDMEIAKYIANKYNFKLDIKDVTFDSIIAGISEDNAIGLAAITYDTGRAEKVLFSDFYYTGAVQTVLYAKGTTPTLTEDGKFASSNLSGKKVATQTGTTGHLFVDGNAEDWGCTLKTYTQLVQAVQDFGTAVDYIVVDSNVAEQFVNQYSDKFDKLPCEGAEAESYGAVAKLGNTELMTKVNTALAELLVKDADGQSQIDKWLVQYMTSAK